MSFGMVFGSTKDERFFIECAWCGYYKVDPPAWAAFHHVQDCPKREECEAEVRARLFSADGT